jgi:Carboxypeptidase regulatory-like domain
VLFHRKPVWGIPRNMGQRPFKCILVVITVTCLLQGKAGAQNTSNATRAGAELPDAPESGSGIQSSEQRGSISGTIVDSQGSGIPNAEVTLRGSEEEGQRVAISDISGKFVLSDPPAGTFRLTIDAEGLHDFNAGQVVLTAHEVRELPTIVLPIVTARADVTVTASSEQIAQAQVQLAEHQRVLGVIPNFYSSYIWDAAPLTPKLKFHLALRSAIDPVAFLLAGGVAGIEQAHNTFPGYDSGLGGYAKRYGAAYGDHVIGAMIGRAMLPSLFHQDPRYFYKGKGSTRSRVFYAIEAAVIARGDNGRQQPNYSNLLGNFAAAGIANLYRSPEDRSASLTFRNGLVITGTDALGNLIREFVLRNLTSKVPPFAQGQPECDRSMPCQ